jgi:mycoredoxin
LAVRWGRFLPASQGKSLSEVHGHPQKVPPDTGSRMARTHPPVTLFTAEWCGYCRRLKRQMDDAGIAYAEVDIDVETQYGTRIIAATGGYRTVPTAEIDGRLLVNPTLDEVVAAVGG